MPLAGVHVLGRTEPLSPVGRIDVHYQPLGQDACPICFFHLRRKDDGALFDDGMRPGDEGIGCLQQFLKKVCQVGTGFGFDYRPHELRAAKVCRRV